MAWEVMFESKTSGWKGRQYLSEPSHPMAVSGPRMRSWPRGCGDGEHGQGRAVPKSIMSGAVLSTGSLCNFSLTLPTPTCDILSSCWALHPGPLALSYLPSQFVLFIHSLTDLFIHFPELPGPGSSSHTTTLYLTHYHTLPFLLGKVIIYLLTTSIF